MYPEVGRRSLRSLDSLRSPDSPYKGSRVPVRSHSDAGNASFGSVEGVGGLPGCDSREVELENR